MNDVMVLGEGGQLFCDDSSKAYVIKSVTLGREGLKILPNCERPLSMQLLRIQPDLTLKFLYFDKLNWNRTCDVDGSSSRSQLQSDAFANALCGSSHDANLTLQVWRHFD